MRRSKTFVLGTLMVVGLLIGPGAGMATARTAAPPPTSSASFFPCTPHGSGDGGPTTTWSAVLLYDNSSQDKLTCFFPNINQVTSTQAGQHSEFGGSCYFNAGMNVGVEFNHRSYIVIGNTASLICWDGVVECMDAVGTASVCSTSVHRRLPGPGP